jgi:hypothetical protein
LPLIFGECLQFLQPADFFANAGLVSIATTTKVDKTNFAFSDFIV